MKAKFVNEALSDLLQPKSQSEIDKDLQELSGDELYDMWQNTNNNDFLKYALKHQDFINSLGLTDITEIVASGVTLDVGTKNIILNKIIEEFSSFSNFKIKQIKDKKYLIFDWEDFADFIDGQDLSLENARMILSGDSYDIF